MPNLTPDEVKRTIMGIDHQAARALCATLYITGARITELVGRRATGGKDGGVPPLRKKQIVPEQWIIDHKPVEVIVFRNLFIQKQQVNKKHYHDIPVPILDHSRWAFQILDDWIDPLKSDDRLFRCNRQRAWGWVNNATGWFPHYFRNLRATHDMGYFGFNIRELMLKMGWSRADTALRYVKATPQDLVRRQLQPLR